MKKVDFFPSKYLCASDLGGQPLVLTIEQAVRTKMKGFNGGEEREKPVLHFKGAKKTLPLNSTNWDAVVDVTGQDDTDKWPGYRVEVFPTTTEVNGNPKDCVRIRKPAELPLGDATKQEQKRMPRSIAGDMDDEIPFALAAVAAIPLLALLVGSGILA